jgi:predicted Zn-dependent protease
VAHAALTHALYGRRAEALALAREALTPRDGSAPSDAVPRVRLLSVLGLVGAPEAARMAAALARQLPDSTLVNGVILPTTRAAIALEAGRPAEAVEALRAAVAYEAGNVAVLIPRYLRGEAYLASGQAARALEEFEKILAQRGADPFSPVVALAPLGVARARSALGEREKAAQAYAAFFEAWRNADADVPVLVAARAEYQRLGVR